MKHRGRYIAIGVVALVITAYFATEAFDKLNDPDRVAYMLNIAEPPPSLQVFECESGPPTDVVITCAIEIDPREFPLLLNGYAYSQSQIDGTSYSNTFANVGPEFSVDVEYIVRPTTFKDGGSVTVLANHDRNHAIVDLYIE